MFCENILCQKNWQKKCFAKKQLEKILGKKLKKQKEKKKENKLKIKIEKQLDKKIEIKILQMCTFARLYICPPLKKTLLVPLVNIIFFIWIMRDFDGF